MTNRNLMKVRKKESRDQMTAALNLANLDITSEVSKYGGGNSFSLGGNPDLLSALMTRLISFASPPVDEHTAY